MVQLGGVGGFPFGKQKTSCGRAAVVEAAFSLVHPFETLAERLGRRGPRSQSEVILLLLGEGRKKVDTN